MCNETWYINYKYLDYQFDTNFIVNVSIFGWNFYSSYNNHIKFWVFTLNIRHLYTSNQPRKKILQPDRSRFC